MSMLRSFSFSKLKKSEEDTMSKSPYNFVPAHSRDSSGTSSSSSPITSTFSNRSHNRWPSSSSSLATTPDSPANVTKSALHDLVEDPAERDDALDMMPSHSSSDEPLCICDTPFCEHRQTPMANTSGHFQPLATPEWTPGDDYFCEGSLTDSSSLKQRDSGEISADTVSSRLSRRFPSISARWKDNKPTTSASNINVRSAPPSRAPSRTPSLRLPSMRRRIEPASTPATPPFTPIESQPEENELTSTRTTPKAQKPLEIYIAPRDEEDPIDRKELASTPLLPPMMAEHHSYSTEELSSPLQSPSVAGHSTIGTPISTPAMPGCPTPPLSSKPSTTSFNLAQASRALSAEISPMSITDEDDIWTIKLGHANFYIKPEPYYPETCTRLSCNRLRDDWESARREYMRIAARVSEHYGPTSQTFKFTEAKWAEIDAQWRTNHERANAEAEASGEETQANFQPLAETQPLSKMPSFNDPEQPAKFPRVEDADIVGPMVQYAKIQRRPSKRAAFLRIFTDPSSLLNGRAAATGIKRW